MYWRLSCLFFLVGVSVTFSQPIERASKYKKTTYLIGLSDNPPISYLNKQNKAEGMIVDLLNEIALKEKFQIQWVFDEWDTQLKNIKNGKIDLLTSVGYIKERTMFMDYSKEGFVTSWSSIYLPNDSQIENFIDLDNKTIAMLIGDINGMHLKSRCVKFEITCKYEYANTNTELFDKIASGEVDAIVSNNIAGIWYANKFELMTSSIMFNPSMTFVTAPKVHSGYLLDLYDDYLANWKNDPNSFYYKIKSKWLTLKGPTSFSSYAIYTIVISIIIALLALLTAFVFKKQVNKRVKELSVRNEQFSQIINLVPHMIYVSEDNGNILLANKKASQYFGMTSDEIDRCKIDNLQTQNNKELSFLNDNNLSKGIKEIQLQEIETKDYLDNSYTLLLSKMPFKISGEKNRANVTVAVDITEIKRYEQRIRHMAHYETLTGLPNKSLFKLQIEKSIKSHQLNNTKGAVLFVDLDSFKNINDSQGHLIGDLLLKAVTKRFKQNIVDENILSHFGGDEFIIDLPNLDKDDVIAEELAVDFGNFILDEISKPYEIEGRGFQITASMGIVIYPRDADSEHVLLQRSDTALNEAKQRGRNCLQLFDKKLEKSVIENHILETELRQAVDASQFTLVFQPIVQGKNKHIVGSEALLRWSHPTKGEISPGEFIEAAERIHLLVKIGYWVIEEVCKVIKDNMKHSNSDGFIAVNVSVLQLKDAEFYNSVERCIRKYSIPANHLEFEITESVLMEDVEHSINIFNKFKLLGIKISIDDFGTGYSSFSYLIKLPIDKIKIDRSFVKDLPENKNSATVVRTIIKMAKELDVSILAEGIEEIEQYDFLISEGCDYFQGYYLHRPMQYDKILKLNS